MAWQTPKTDWAAGDGVANGDLNRIEENIRMLSQSAGAYGICTGSANAYSVTVSPPLTSLSYGACVAVKINVTNTAGSTINVNGLGAKAIKRGNGLDVEAEQLKAGSIYTLRYNGVNFTLQGDGGLSLADKQILVDLVDAHKAENATLETLGHVKHGVFTTTILSADWTGTTAPFTQVKTISGILATDTPIVDVVMSGTYATDEARQEAWNNIYRITTANNSITLYAKEKPTVNLPIQLKVVR